ncbi:TnsA-like heteromeric transposase endonuclease subunit [Streptomyces lavendulae]|uniref:TnsA-like heteromeric transposase endonuclease subunit n=1 Tax=Streptomyces lavendulae TaxID=1914 RepID=UPI0033C81527
MATPARAFGDEALSAFELGFRRSGDSLRLPLGKAWNVRFEEAEPVRPFRWAKGGESFAGWYWAVTTVDHVGYESWLERDRLILLDRDPEVVGIASQPFWLHWDDGQGQRRHAPDYFVRLADGRARVIDVRAADRMDERTEEAFASTRRACEAVGWEFQQVGTPEPVFMANVRWLARYRRDRSGPSAGLAGAVPPAVVREAGHRSGVRAAGNGEPGPGREAGVVSQLKRPPRVVVGDRVRFSGQLRGVLAVSAVALTLTDEEKSHRVVPLLELFEADDFEVVGTPMRMPLPPASLLETFPAAVMEKALWWEGHILEVMHGLPPGAEPGTVPRPEYGPDRSLTARQRAKAAELTEAGHPTTSSTVAHRRRSYQEQGVIGPADHRPVRKTPRFGEADEAVVEAMRQAIDEAVDASARTEAAPSSFSQFSGAGVMRR